MLHSCQHEGCDNPTDGAFCAEHKRSDTAELLAAAMDKPKRHAGVVRPRHLEVVLIDDGADPDPPAKLGPRALAELTDEVTASGLIRRAGKVRSPVA